MNYKKHFINIDGVSIEREYTYTDYVSTFTFIECELTNNFYLKFNESKVLKLKKC